MDKKEEDLLKKLERAQFFFQSFNSMITNSLLITILFVMLLLTGLLNGMPTNLAIIIFCSYGVVLVLILIIVAYFTYSRIKDELPDLLKF